MNRHVTIYIYIFFNSQSIHIGVLHNLLLPSNVHYRISPLFFKIDFDVIWLLWKLCCLWATITYHSISLSFSISFDFFLFVDLFGYLSILFLFFIFITISVLFSFYFRFHFFLFFARSPCFNNTFFLKVRRVF